jgi:urease accessory protein UreH
VVTKESTDRKSENAIDTHTLRFAINSNSLVEVYVDGVLLFVEDQLVDNVKAKMQLIDKFNKFIFLVNTYVDSLAEQARIMQDTQEAKENFQQF